MGKWHKLFAGLGATLALLMVVQFSVPNEIKLGSRGEVSFGEAAATGDDKSRVRRGIRAVRRSTPAENSAVDAGMSPMAEAPVDPSGTEAARGEPAGSAPDVSGADPRVAATGESPPTLSEPSKTVPAGSPIALAKSSMEATSPHHAGATAAQAAPESAASEKESRPLGFGAGLTVTLTESERPSLPAELPPVAATPAPPASEAGWTAVVSRHGAASGPASTEAVAPAKSVEVQAELRQASVQGPALAPAPEATIPLARDSTSSPIPAAAASAPKSAPPAADIAASSGSEAPGGTAAPASTPAPVADGERAPVLSETSDRPRSYAPADAKKDSILTRSPGKPETAWTDTGEGIADSNKRIAPVLALHPEHDLVLCLAGCGAPGISIVEIRQKPRVVAATYAEMQPSSAGTPLPGAGDVVCLAGCAGAPGEVVFRNVRLSWISNGGSDTIKGALRAIADRLIAADGLSIEPRRLDWMSATARAHLIDEAAAGRPHDKLAFAGPEAAAWMRRMPGIALALDDH